MGISSYRVLAPFTLAVVVMYVNRALQVGGGFGDLVDGVHHQVQHELAVLEGIALTPSHVLQQCSCPVAGQLTINNKTRLKLPPPPPPPSPPFPQ